MDPEISNSISFFDPFDPKTGAKLKIFKNPKKSPQGVPILHTHTKNHDGRAKWRTDVGVPPKNHNAVGDDEQKINYELPYEIW